MKRSKIIAIGLACILFGTILSAIATRTITDTSDTIYTMITNSKGNSWTATDANINTALWDLNGTGGAVYLPSGIINFTSPITPSNHTKLCGAGIGTTILRAGGTFSDPNNFGMIKVYAARNNITISDLTVWGNSSATGFGHTGIHIGANTIASGSGLVSDVIIENVYVKNPLICGIETGEYASRVHIKNVYVDSPVQQHGLSISGNRVTVDGAFISNILKDLYIGFGCSADNSTMNNIIIDNTRYGSKIINCHNTTFNNIIFKNIWNHSGYGISVQTSSNLSFNNIHIMGSNNGTKGGCWNGLEVYSTTKNINLNNINIFNASNIGLEIQATKKCIFNNINIQYAKTYSVEIEPSASDIQLNNIHTAYSGSFYIYNADNITVDNLVIVSFVKIAPALSVNIGKYITLSNIKIINCADYAILLTSMTYSTISNAELSTGGDNLIKMTTCSFFTINNVIANKNGNDIIVSGGGCNNFTISNSIISSSSARGIYLSTTDSNVTIVNCIFRGNTGDAIESNIIDSLILMGNNFVGVQNFDDNSVRRHNINGSSYNLGYNKI